MLGSVRSIETILQIENRFFFFFFLISFMHLLLASLGLCCCARTFSSCGEQRLLPKLWYAGFLVWRLLLLRSSGSRAQLQ